MVKRKKYISQRNLDNIDIDISNDLYCKWVDSETTEIYVIVVYRKGIGEKYFITKRKWEEVYKQIN